MKIQDLQNDLANELTNTSKDTIIDYVEIGLDSILNNEKIKEVPLVKTLVASCNVGLNIKEWYFAQKLIKFLFELKNEQISDESLQEFKTNMEKESFKKHTTERLIIIIDKLEEINKTIYITKFFKGFIEKKITWEDFCVFSKYIDFITAKDFEVLRFLGNYVYHNEAFEELSIAVKKGFEGNANKLMQFNFVKIHLSANKTSNAGTVSILYSLTDDGVKFLSCIN